MTTTISLNAKMKIGYKFELTVSNGIKIMAAKNRQILITLENDLYNIYAFTLKGVNMVKEVKMTGIFAGQNLEEAIIKAANV